MLDRGLLFLLLQVVGVLGQECAVGKYGEHCQLNCSRSCAPYSGQDVHCDRRSGKCSEGCIPGWYGDQCQLSCSKNCGGHICSHQTGHCTSGCKGNNTGDFCETPQESGPKQGASEQLQEPASTPLAAILVPVFVILIIIIIIIIIITVAVYRRRRRRRKSNRPSDDVEQLEPLNPGGVDTDLIVACREGKLKAVKDTLDKRPEDISKKGCGGMTPLLWAARRGHREVVDMLVRQAADVNVVDGAGNNILHWACYGGHVAMVKHVVSKKMVDINSKGQGGRTPLMWAAREGRGDFFQILVSKGGLPSQVDKEGNNILLLACSGANVEIVESIISHADDNMDIDGRGLSGRTPLMVAAHKGCRNIFELLVNRGANQELFDDVNDNVLHLACQGGNVDIVSRVLELGKVDKNSRGQCSRTPLMMAARLGHKEIFHLLVSEGADASLLDDEKNNILHLACEGGRIDMVEYVLLLNIVNISARNKRNETATMLATEGGDVFNLLVSHGHLMDTGLQAQDTDLHVACREGKLKAVKDILDQSPEDINKKGGSGMTPLLWAARRGHKEVVDMLVRQAADVTVVDGAGNNILHWACYGGHVEMVKYVVSKKMVDIDSKGQGGRTSLMWAAREGRREFFEILESEGGPPSQVDKEGNNILLLACSGGNVEIVESILSHAYDNFDIDGRGLSGRTPLMVAAHKGCRNIFELLVNRGANQELFDDVNDNVLHLACQGGNVDIVSRVLELGKVDKNSKGQCSRTPLMMAARLGHKEIFHLLVSEGADASLLDDEKNNILHLACEGERIDMVEYVLSLNIVNINARNEQNETATMLATEGGEVYSLLESHGGLSK